MPSGSGKSGGASAGAIKAGGAYFDLWAKDGISGVLDRMKRKALATVSFLQKLGGTFAATGAAGAAALAPLAVVVNALGENSKIADAADAFGLTGEKASRLFGIMKAGGSDIKDATEGIVTFNQRIEDGLSGSGVEAKNLFEGLGRSADSFTGDSADKFFQLIDALKAVPDPAKRVQLLLKAVGEDTGKNLIPVLAMTNDEMRALGDTVQTSSADLKESREATRAWQLALVEVKAVVGQIVTATAPAIKLMVGLLRQVVAPVAEWVKANQGLATGLALVAGAVAAGGIALLALGGALSLVGTAGGVAVAALGAIKAAVLLLLSPIGIAVAVVGGLTYAFLRFTEQGRAVADWIGGGLSAVFDTLKTTIGGVLDAMRAGDFEKAGKIAVAGLTVVWLEFRESFTAMWGALKVTVGNFWTDLKLGAQLTFSDISAFGESAFEWLGTTIGNVFRAIARAILSTAIMVGEALNKLDPSNRLLTAIAVAKGVRSGLTDVDPTARLDEIEADRAAEARGLALDARAEKKERADRAAGDLLAAQERLAKAKAELAALTAAPAVQDFGGGGDFGSMSAAVAAVAAARGIAQIRAAMTTGGMGMAAQQFGYGTQRDKELGALNRIADGRGDAPDRFAAAFADRLALA